MKIQRQIISAVLLMAYAVTGTSLVPAVLLMLARLDGSHSVQVCESNGETRLLLHHSEDHYTPRVCDHEKPLTRAIVSFCRPDHEGDHSLVAAHMGKSINTENHLLKHAVKNRPMLNDAATQSLVLTISEVIVPRSLTMISVDDGNCMQHHRHTTATVQMLI